MGTYLSVCGSGLLEEPVVLELNIPWQESGVLHKSALNSSASVEPAWLMLSMKLRESAETRKMKNND